MCALLLLLNNGRASQQLFWTSRPQSSRELNEVYFQGSLRKGTALEQAKATKHCRLLSKVKSFSAKSLHSGTTVAVFLETLNQPPSHGQKHTTATTVAARQGLPVEKPLLGVLT